MDFISVTDGKTNSGRRSCLDMHSDMRQKGKNKKINLNLVWSNQFETSIMQCLVSFLRCRRCFDAQRHSLWSQSEICAICRINLISPHAALSQATDLWEIWWRVCVKSSSVMAKGGEAANCKSAHVCHCIRMSYTFLYYHGSS